MPLSNDLITQFAKVTNDKTEVKTETTVYGKVVEKSEDGKTAKVQLDGSDMLTPVTLTADAAVNDRVAVEISKHKAKALGNATSPSATSQTVTEVNNVATEAGRKATMVVQSLAADEASINNLIANKATILDLIASKATIEELIAKKATIEWLIAEKITASEAEIEELYAKKAEINELIADYATIETLEASEANIKKLIGDEAFINKLVADKATINSLFAKKAEINELIAKYATIENLDVEIAEIEKLFADYATIEKLETDYANIDFANIGDAAIDKLYSNFAFLANVTSEDGVFTGDLVAVNINADMIKSGTLATNRLLVKGDNGLYYKLNVDGMGQATADELPEEEQKNLQNGLHGSNIIAQTITADKVNVSDLHAFDAKIGGFVIDEDSIHSSVKTSVDNSTRGIYLDNEGQMNVGDTMNYVKYYKEGDDYKLDISANSIKMGGNVAHVVRRFEGSVNQVECIDEQGIRVVSEFEPTQSGEGDPSPDNIRTISGRSEASMTRCGKNLIDIASMYATSNSAIEYTSNAIRVYSTADGTYRSARTKPMILRNGVRYTLSMTVTDIPGGYARVGFRRQSNNSFITNTYATFSEVGSQTVTFRPTADIEAYFSVMVTSSTDAAGDATVANIQFEIADEVTAYETFEGDHYSIEFGETIYGGSLDWTTGILSVDREIMTFDGTESWAYYDSATYPYFYINFAEYGTVSGELEDGVSTHFKSQAINSTTNNIGFNVYNSPASDMSRVAIRPGISSVVDKASWTAYLAEQYAAGTPVQVCYKVTNPREIHLTPSQVISLDGLNTVYTDIKNGYMDFGKDSLSTLGGVTQFEFDDYTDRITTAEHNIDVLNGVISSLVVGENGETLLTQTEDGWTFNLYRVKNDAEYAKSKADENANDVKDLNEESETNANNISNLRTDVDGLKPYSSYVVINETEDGNPKLELGRTGGDFKTVITNTAMQFKEREVVAASISNQSLHIGKAVIEDELSHGGFVWTSRENGNWGILWKGGV